MKRLIASLLSVAFVTGMLLTTTGCPDSGKKTPEKKPDEKTEKKTT